MAWSRSMIDGYFGHEVWGGGHTGIGIIEDLKSVW